MFIEINNNYYNARFMSGLSETTEEVDNATKYVVVYSFANGDIIKEYFDTQNEADSKFAEVKDTSAGGGGITPTGTISITSNANNIDVTNYASADVNVPGITPTGTLSITQNGTVDVTNYASANVSVSAQVLTIPKGATNTGGYNYVIQQIPSLTVDGTDCSNMFCGYKGNKIPTLIGVDSGNITNFSYMFSGCSAVTSIDVANYNTSKSTNLSNMFYGCLNVRHLDCSNFTIKDTNTSIGSMFYNCRKLATLDISGFDVSKIGQYCANVFSSTGYQCLQSNGAYADGIPYVYVKDAAMQNWVLNTDGIGRPDNWTTDNVIIKNSNN